LACTSEIANSALALIGSIISITGPNAGDYGEHRNQSEQAEAMHEWNGGPRVGLQFVRFQPRSFSTITTLQKISLRCHHAEKPIETKACVLKCEVERTLQSAPTAQVDFLPAQIDGTTLPSPN
jgi:hypothetical protein